MRVSDRSLFAAAAVGALSLTFTAGALAQDDGPRPLMIVAQAEGDAAAPAAEAAPAEAEAAPAEAPAAEAAPAEAPAEAAAPAEAPAAEAAPAEAEAPPAEAPAEAPAQAEAAPASELSSEDLAIGTPVMGSDGVKIGEVNRVTSDAGGKVSGIHVTAGGPAGLGAKVMAIPASQITGTGAEVKVSISSEDAKKLPILGEDG